LAISTTAALVLGIVIGLLPGANALLGPFVSVTSMVPPLALLLLWQSASSAEWVDPAILASPLEVARATWSGALDGSLPGAL
ncbi:hypothetical protein ABTP75_20265, partial [Acinetobacter baumannii]